MDPLRHTLKKIRTRMAVQQWVRLYAKAVMWASVLSLVWVLVVRVVPVLGEPFWGCAGIFAVALLYAGIAGWMGRPKLEDAALAADARLGLKERVTSSLALEHVDSPMVSAVHADARERLKGISFARDFPLAGARRLRWMYVPLIAFGLAYALVPEMDIFRFGERQAAAEMDAEAREVRAKMLKDAVRPLKEDAAVAVASDVADAVSAMEQVADELAANEISEKQALARLSSLEKALHEHRAGLNTEDLQPKLAGDTSKLGLSRELAESIQSGKMGEAAEQMRDLEKKLKEGELDEKQMEALQKDLSELSKMLGGSNSQLGEALANAMAAAGEGLKSGDADAAQKALEEAALSLEDIASLLEQMEMMDTMMANLQQWKGEFLGPSEFCRSCGGKLKQCEHGGDCTSCGPGTVGFGVCGSCAGMGSGMGGPGRGQGNRVGDLPELQVSFNPTKLKGPMTNGQVLASVLQKGVPDEDAAPTVDFVQGAFVEVQQAAEQALTKEEIPPGSKEFVRQYFGSLEPEASSN